MDPEKIIEQLSSISGKLSDTQDKKARNEALQLSRKLTASLEEPMNVAVDLCFSPMITLAVRIAIDLNIFKRVAENDAPLSSKELASLSGGEELLIIRIARPLASMGFLDEVDVRTWGATPLTRAMATEGIAAGHRLLSDVVGAAANKGPKYFKEAGYACPTNPRNGLLQYALQTKLTSFQLLEESPDMLRDFNSWMGNTMGARNSWIDWFPIQDILLDGFNRFNTDTALLVDVGAGKGHDLLAFHDKYPNYGRLVLQDLPPVIKAIEALDPAIDVMAYNFFTPQPVKGARAYFYHHILHDWSDQKCLQILKEVSLAMKRGYSKLLLHEMIIPDKGASTFYSRLDLTMMTFNGGMERTKNQWKDLLQQAGLAVVRIWPPPQEGADGMVEAMLQD